MFVINANNGQEVITEAKYISNSQQQLTFTGASGQGGSWIDKTNKYLYMVIPYTAAPYFGIRRYEYDGGEIKNAVNMTLSFGGSFSSTPTFTVFQGSHSGDFFLYIANGGGGTLLSGNTVYPITISGTTATLGSANAVPVVASYTVRHVFAKNTNLYAYYSLTASPYTSDVGRKYTGSWATLTGAALLSSVGSFATNSGVSQNGQSCCPCGASGEWAYIFESGGPSSTDTGARLDTTTDTWSLESRIANNISSDINGYLHSAGKIIMNDGSSVVTNTSIPSQISDINNGLLHSTYSSTQHYYNGSFIGNNKRIRKIHSPNAAANYGMIYSLDGGTTWSGLQYLSTLISADYNLNYFGDLICIAFNNNTSIFVYVEIV